MRKPSEYFSEYFQFTVFPAYLSTLKNPQTRDVYWRSVCLLCDYCKKDFLELTNTDIENYYGFLMSRYHKEEFSRKTINLRFSCYKSVAGYIVDYLRLEDYQNYFQYIEPIPFDPNVPISRVPTLYDMDLILTKAKEVNVMYYLIISLAARCGLPVTDISKIRKEDITYTPEGLIVLRFKGTSKYMPDRYMALPSDVSSIMEHYLKDNEVEDYIFLNARNNPITVRNIDRSIGLIVETCGLDEGKHFTMKDFRTRAIVDMKKTEATESEISEYTGMSRTRLIRFDKVVDQVHSCPAGLVNYELKTEG